MADEQRIVAYALHDEGDKDLRDELFEILDDPNNDCTLCTIDDIQKVFEARFKQAKAEAWSEGHQDGWSDRAHIGEDITRNPYRGESHD